MVRVTLYDSFFHQEFTGEFESVQEAKELYAYELDCMADDLEVIRVEEI